MNVNHTVIIDPELNSTMMVALGSAFNPSLPLHAPPPIRPAHGWMWQWFCPQILRVITYNCWFQNLFRPWTMGLDLGSAFNPSLPLHPPPSMHAHMVECDNGFVPRSFGLIAGAHNGLRSRQRQWEDSWPEYKCQNNGSLVNL